MDADRRERTLDRRARPGGGPRMSLAVPLAVRYLLVCLFFPFSALDKIINFKGAVGQAKELVSAPGGRPPRSSSSGWRSRFACRSPS